MKIEQDSIWLINFDPSLGHEIQKTRPAIVISNTFYNLAAGTVFVVPLTSQIPDKKFQSFFVKILPNKNSGLTTDSFANITQNRAVSKKRFIKCLGKTDANVRTELVKKWLGMVSVDPLEIRYLQ